MPSFTFPSFSGPNLAQTIRALDIQLRPSLVYCSHLRLELGRWNPFNGLYKLFEEVESFSSSQTIEKYGAQTRQEYKAGHEPGTGQTRVQLNPISPFCSKTFHNFNKKKKLKLFPKKKKNKLTQWLHSKNLISRARPRQKFFWLLVSKKIWAQWIWVSSQSSISPKSTIFFCQNFLT